MLERVEPLINFSVQDVLGVGPASKNIMDALRAGLGDLFSPWLEARRGAAEQRTAKGGSSLPSSQTSRSRNSTSQGSRGARTIGSAPRRSSDRKAVKRWRC